MYKRQALSPTRDFNYVLDTVRAFEAVLQADQSVGQVLNAGSNYEISIGAVSYTHLSARVHEVAKSRYVVAFQQPTLPDESLYPRPFLFTAYVFVGALLLLGLGSLITASIREHAGF